MKRLLIVGGGKGGTALLRTLTGMKRLKVVGVVDIDPHAPALQIADTLGIPTGGEITPFLEKDPDAILEVTGDRSVYDDLCRSAGKEILVVSGDVAHLMVQLIEEKERWFEAWRLRQRELDAILNSTHDGMIAVDREGLITLFNRAAERLAGIQATQALGKPVSEIIPGTRLNRVLNSGLLELNRQQELPNGTKIITNRVPVKDKKGQVIGAVAVFRDITEFMSLTQQVTDLESMKSMLQAIIDSSDDAISVVDAKGVGILINPAYTRLTGLTAEEVIGKPAETDISEGESMHMKVLKTLQPVRGVPMKVGPHRKDVIVNVAPIMVDDQLKGSVGIIHDMSEIKRLTGELERARRIIRTLEGAKYTFSDIIGESEAMQWAVEQARQAATTRATVLLRGESGTGKELFAHSIHNHSDRKLHSFIRVNCAAISESLLESELFGYVEGAFTGARQGGKKGLFEEACGGTIFLDEIGELAPRIQAKLLRVLQEKEVVRVGSTRPIPVDVRVIAATNVDLEKAIDKKSFREDLYYRLNVLPIFIPPLRKREGDMHSLSIHLIKKFNREYGRNVESISSAALERLAKYSWPGNVRELENILGRAMIHMPFHGRRIEVEHLPLLEATPFQVQEKEVEVEETMLLRDVVAQAEEKVIRRVYSACKGNKTETARRLGISIRNLYYKLERYQIEWEPYRDQD